MIDLNTLTHDEKEALSEDCEDYLVHRHIPLYSHSYDEIIIQAIKEGYQTEKFDRYVWRPVELKDSGTGGTQPPEMPS